MVLNSIDNGSRPLHFLSNSCLNNVRITKKHKTEQNCKDAAA